MKRETPQPVTRPVWPEAEIIAEPTGRCTDPQVLVRRRTSGLVGPGVDIAYFEGDPVISLFTGAGGIDIGLERAGYETVLQHEWSEGACQTLLGNRPNFFRRSALIQGDIRKTPSSMLLREAGLQIGECSLVCGGPPCQGFTTANTNALKGKYDIRNDLVFEYLRVVNDIKPKFFMFENVKGFVQFNKGDYPKRFLAHAYNCYYELVYGLLDCCEYGVPQHRCRFICMGTRRDIVETKNVLAGLPKPQHFGKNDIIRLETGENDPALREECELIRQAPGVRYFPDREFICNPDPTGHDGSRSKAFLKFYKDLKINEPDRIVISA